MLLFKNTPMLSKQEITRINIAFSNIPSWFVFDSEFDESENGERMKGSRKSECYLASIIFVFNNHMKKSLTSVLKSKNEFRKKNKSKRSINSYNT